MRLVNLFLVLLVLAVMFLVHCFILKNANAADTDRSAEYILNRVWDSENNILRVK